MNLISLFLGITLLIMGRRLFWLFLCGVGFFLGFDLASRLLQGQPHDILLIVASIAGFLGAMMALFFQKLAILVGGFIAGGYLLTSLLTEFGLKTGQYHWIVFLVGGLLGAVFMKVLFGWTLIILSSFIGAGLILKSYSFNPRVISLLFIFLIIFGIAIQAGLIGKKPPGRRH